MRATRKALANAAADGDERGRIETAMAQLETAMRGIDYNRIRDLTDELNRVTTALAQRIMDTSIKEALERKRVEDVV
jgi:ABC-type transporter Mla subunit MlaD